MEKSTDKILSLIKSATSEREFLKIRKENIQKSDFGGFVLSLCDKYEITSGQLQLNLVDKGVSKSNYHKVLSGKGRPSKLTVIKFALTLGASIEETDKLLKLAGHKELYAKDTDDSILIFCMQNGYDIYKTDEMLTKNGSKYKIFNS